MIKITDKPLSPDTALNEVKTTSSGCAILYVGLIRDNSNGKEVASVEYSDPKGTAEQGLQAIVEELNTDWELNGVALHHRITKMVPGDINLVVAISAAHRSEAIDACRRAVDLFKEKLPTAKVETYTDGSSISYEQ
ncbi:MAG: molybdenum cofactor biosynthesis protein MoaE [Dehalococcoidales bacterium]|nr:molybdenum cofactor biosynthesis protein MoaE [Dehalococcoidales bacterium]